MLLLALDRHVPDWLKLHTGEEGCDLKIKRIHKPQRESAVPIMPTGSQKAQLVTVLESYLVSWLISIEPYAWFGHWPYSELCFQSFF